MIQEFNIRPFPYCLAGVEIKPIFTEMKNSLPMYLSLAADSPFRPEFEDKPQTEFSDAVYNRIHGAHGVTWSVGGYLENRCVGLDKYPQMREQKRYYHLGIDLNFAKGTAVHAPLNGEIAVSGYEEGAGNYGGHVVIKCKENGTVFYLLFGHLRKSLLPVMGAPISAGQKFAEVGDFDENGAWYQHIHLQVLTEKAFAEGWVNKGYCSLEDIPSISQYAPDPALFLI
ncbi:MAG: peptidoglycan DD-metalloendopeptidase family protein [Oscillospiraceae bacterium]|nr:peptidoglycan DD-metalloendopeptidase family protein [Oscillospiraceae bacterium]